MQGTIQTLFTNWLNIGTAVAAIVIAFYLMWAATSCSPPAAIRSRCCAPKKLSGTPSPVALSSWRLERSLARSPCNSHCHCCAAAYHRLSQDTVRGCIYQRPVMGRS